MPSEVQDIHTFNTHKNNTTDYNINIVRISVFR